MKKLSAGAIALVLLVSAPLWGDPVAHSATSLSKSVKRALGMAKKADKRSKAALRRANAALTKGGPTGPRGPAGANGAPGKDGAPGPVGPAGAVSAVATRHSPWTTVPTNAGSTAAATAACEPGETALSGGWSLSLLHDDVTAVVDRPAVNGAATPPNGTAPTGWHVVVMRTENGFETYLKAFAVCAT